MILVYTISIEIARLTRWRTTYRILYILDAIEILD